MRKWSAILHLYLLQDCFRSHQCQPCAPIIEEYSGMVLRFVGGIGLFFSFTEVSRLENSAFIFIFFLPVIVSQNKALSFRGFITGTHHIVKPN